MHASLRAGGCLHRAAAPAVLVPRRIITVNQVRSSQARSSPASAHQHAAPTAPTVHVRQEVLPEGQVAGMPAFLDSLKWDSNGLVAVIVQHVDTGELLMQAFADRAAISETMQTGLGTFYSRSRKGRWCKGETSGHFLKVLRLFTDCDRDSIIYLTDPVGPACHTGARTCWFSEATLGDTVHETGSAAHTNHASSTLLALESIIEQRRTATGGKPSWTAKLINDPQLLCSKVREEAGELCETWEAKEGHERTVSEMADLLYHSMVLLNVQGVGMEEVLRELRQRFTMTGIEEKASRVKH